MACQKSLDFAAPPGTDAHLSFYWTMDEAGDLNKVDSAAGAVWNATTGNLSPPGKFVNGIQLDCIFVGGVPFFHGLRNLADPTFSFNAATSTGVSVCFWINKTVDQIALPASLFEFNIECHDAGYTIDAELVIFASFAPAAVTDNLTVRHADFSGGPDTSFTATFLPVTGAWHMIAATIDFTAKTLNLYIDGVLVTSMADLGIFHTAPLGDLTLKCDFGAAGNTLTILVDEFLLSLKGALTAAQVLAMFNANAGMTWPTVTAVVPYP